MTYTIEDFVEPLVVARDDTRLYIVGEWPKVTEISRELASDAKHVDWAGGWRKGARVMFNFHNGSRVYVCEKIHGARAVLRRLDR